MQAPAVSTRTRVIAICNLAAWIGMAAAALPARAGVIGQPIWLTFDTELTNLDLKGGPFPMPLASDPGNALGDSVNGYGFVDSEVRITLSSQRAVNPGPASNGSACAFLEGPAAAEAAVIGRTFCDSFGDPPPEIDPDALDGSFFIVDSFFDVFFDITVTDVDARPGRDYAGQPDGASIVLPDTGPAEMQSSYFVPFVKTAPNFGLIPPPEADPYIGHVQIEIPLGADINGNGEDDKVKFTLVTHSVGDGNRQFVILPDGTVLDQFDSAAFVEGAIVDLSQDPPFQIGGQQPNGLPDPSAFGGPTGASSKLLNPIAPASIPAVSQWGLVAAAAALVVGGMIAFRRRKAALT